MLPDPEAVQAVQTALESDFIPVSQQSRVSILGLLPGISLPGIDPARAMVRQDWAGPAQALRQADWHVVDRLAPASADLALVWPSKQRDRAWAEIAEAWESLVPGGLLAVAASNRQGGARWQGDLAVLGAVEGFAKHKARVSLVVRGDRPMPHAADTAQTMRDVGGFISVPGIFSWDRIDPGTKFLIDCLGTEQTDGIHRVLDLGCGWGALTLHLLRSVPGLSQVTAVEADRLALAALRANLAQCPPALAAKVTPLWADARSLPADLRGQFDAVVMNPPFHEGRATATDLGLAFIDSAVAALRPGGRIWLVANRMLPYEASLRATLTGVQTLVERDGFKVLTGRKP